MLSLLQFDLPVLAAALAIGLVTARWLRRGASHTSSTDQRNA